MLYLTLPEFSLFSLRYGQQWRACNRGGVQGGQRFGGLQKLAAT